MRWLSKFIFLIGIYAFIAASHAGSMENITLAEEYLADIERIIQKSGKTKPAPESRSAVLLGKRIINNPNAYFLEREMPQLASFRSTEGLAVPLPAGSEPTRLTFVAIRAQKPDSPLLRPTEIGRILTKPKSQIVSAIYESLITLFIQDRHREELWLATQIEPRYLWAKVEGKPIVAIHSAIFNGFRYCSSKFPAYIQSASEAAAWAFGLTLRAIRFAAS